MTPRVRRIRSFLRDCWALPRRVAALSRQLAMLSDKATELHARLETKLEDLATGQRRMAADTTAALSRVAGGNDPAFAYLGGFTGLATLKSGLRMFVDTRDRHIVPHILTVGVWESWNERLVAKLLKPGDTFLEVGSNVGWFALLAGSLIGESGCGHLFEAHPRLAKLLETSVEINGFASRLTVHPIAAGDRREPVDFLIQENYLGSGHVLGSRVHHIAGSSIIKVDMATIDETVPPDFDLRLMHLDAEGSEPSILRGAKELIRRSPRLAIITEWGFDTKGQRDELEWLENEGFKFWIVEHDASLRTITVDDLVAVSLCDVLCARASLQDLGL